MRSARQRKHQPAWQEAGGIKRQCYACHVRYCTEYMPLFFYKVGCILCCLGNAAAQAFTARGCSGIVSDMLGRIAAYPTAFPMSCTELLPMIRYSQTIRSPGWNETPGQAQLQLQSQQALPNKPSPISAARVYCAATLKLSELSGKGNDETPCSWQGSRQTHG